MLVGSFSAGDFLGHDFLDSSHNPIGVLLIGEKNKRVNYDTIFYWHPSCLLLPSWKIFRANSLESKHKSSL